MSSQYEPPVHLGIQSSNDVGEWFHSQGGGVFKLMLSDVPSGAVKLV